MERVKRGVRARFPGVSVTDMPFWPFADVVLAVRPSHPPWRSPFSYRVQRNSERQTAVRERPLVPRQLATADLSVLASTVIAGRCRRG